MTVPSIFTVRTTLACLLTAASLAACNIGSYDDAVARFNENAAPPPPPAGTPPPPPGASFGPSFSAIQAGLFTPTCATSTCHAGANPAAGLNLEAANSYAMLVGTASTQDPGTVRVNPGNPAQSYLIQKLEGSGASGGQMPPSGALPQADIDVVSQWISDGAIDDRVQAGSPIKVTSLSPLPGAALTAAPTQIVASFDRDVDASTVTATTFILEASNGDMTFGNGNDVVIVATPTVPGTNPRSAVIDLSAVSLADDTYRVRLLGSGGAVIQDLDANALDGEYSGAFPSGDDVEGGDFEAEFSISTPVVLGATLDQIQAVIFGPTCATSNCHAGGSPAAGLDLSDADTSHAALVGMPSSRQAGAVLVSEFDPVNSSLVQKLENAPGIAGSQMPLGRGPLAQSEIDAIRQWIMNGAPR